ncbi:hypothetical protein FDZ73_01005 [bacterium]|nr:MAG: hypothetical protein FDZ73_01005 [bacterium]
MHDQLDHRAITLPGKDAEGVAETAKYERQVSVGLKVTLLQIRLEGQYFAALLGNITRITLQNRQYLSSPSRIFASIS